MGPRMVVETWVTCFNRTDIDGLVALYAEDATNDQVVFDQPMHGRDAIAQMFRLEFGRAKMVCIPENIYEAGDTAILQWRDPKGLRGRGFFTIKHGQIVQQTGYFDQLSFFRQQCLPVPEHYLAS